jgi:hypothetical protein
VYGTSCCPQVITHCSDLHWCYPPGFPTVQPLIQSRVLPRGPESDHVQACNGGVCVCVLGLAHSTGDTLKTPLRSRAGEECEGTANRPQLSPSDSTALRHITCRLKKKAPASADPGSTPLSERLRFLLIAEDFAACATHNNRLSLIAKHVMPIVVCSKNMRSNTWQHGMALPPPTTQLCCVKSLSGPPSRASPINSCFLKCIGPVRVLITYIDIHMLFYTVLLS